ncbi:MAG: hypothetical protein LC660_18575 [Desulfobacteraceae bacterium]|nr:hypothetical protein [Desulfobacteraceae bacterium]
MKIVYQKQGNWIVGHIQEYPDYETQGRTIEELKANLIDIYQFGSGCHTFRNRRSSGLNRKKLIKHLLSMGCEFVRHGGNHD